MITYTIIKDKYVFHKNGVYFSLTVAQFDEMRNLFNKIEWANGDYTGTHDEKLNDWIYIYYIKDDLLIYDRTVSRGEIGMGPHRAREVVAQWKERGYESFYTIGTIPRKAALS